MNVIKYRFTVEHNVHKMNLTLTHNQTKQK